MFKELKKVNAINAHDATHAFYTFWYVILIYKNTPIKASGEQKSSTFESLIDG